MKIFANAAELGAEMARQEAAAAAKTAEMDQASSELGMDGRRLSEAIALLYHALVKMQFDCDLLLVLRDNAELRQVGLAMCAWFGDAYVERCGQPFKLHGVMVTSKPRLKADLRYQIKLEDKLRDHAAAMAEAKRRGEMNAAPKRWSPPTWVEAEGDPLGWGGM